MSPASTREWTANVSGPEPAPRYTGIRARAYCGGSGSNLWRLSCPPSNPAFKTFSARRPAAFHEHWVLFLVEGVVLTSASSTSRERRSLGNPRHPRCGGATAAPSRGTVRRARRCRRRNRAPRAAGSAGRPPRRRTGRAAAPLGRPRTRRTARPRRTRW